MLSLLFIVKGILTVYSVSASETKEGKGTVMINEKRDSNRKIDMSHKNERRFKKFSEKDRKKAYSYLIDIDQI
ncbi:hypothetical protein CSW98_08410 [Vibrio sp. HA2012]|nr:hypothetical protein CSW98_08410 [Vibrio sp. HA2012]